MYLKIGAIYQDSATQKPVQIITAVDKFCIHIQNEPLPFVICEYSKQNDSTNFLTLIEHARCRTIDMALLIMDNLIQRGVSI